MLPVRLGSLLLPAAAAWLLACLMVSPVTVTAFEPCNKPCFDKNAFPITFPSGLTKDMFNTYACLRDPSADCRLADEFSNRPPANAWYGPAAHCNGCDIYFKFCAKTDGSMNTGTLKFVHNGKSPVSTKEHGLVMPNQPCSGVEVWQSRRCGGEKAWDAAFELYKDAKGNPKSYFGYVIGVNSMKKRTRQQLHLHVGTLATGVKRALEEGYNWAKGQKTTFKIACTKAKGGAEISCKFDASKQTDPQNTIVATFAAGASPSAVEPFKTIYGPNTKSPSPPSENTIKHSMGVVASADNQWLILKLLGGAAECLLADEAKDDLKCNPTSSRRRAADAAAMDVDVAATVATAAAAGGGGELVVDDVATLDAAVPGVVDGNPSVPGRRLKL